MTERDDTTTPKRPVVQWPDPAAVEAFYGVAGRIVQAIAPHTESDPVALLTQFLVFFGNAVGRGPHFMVEADRHALNLYLVLVGGTSKGRKGTALGHVKRLFERCDPRWVDGCLTSGLSSGEGLIWAVRDGDPQPDGTPPTGGA
jgi:hypothetical protein